MSILGGILLDNAAMNRVIEILTPDEFYRESHRKENCGVRRGRFYFSLAAGCFNLVKLRNLMTQT